MITEAVKVRVGRNGQEKELPYLRIEGDVVANRADRIMGIHCEISTVDVGDRTIEVCNLRPYGGQLPEVGSHVIFSAETTLGQGKYYMTSGHIELAVS